MLPFFKGSSFQVISTKLRISTCTFPFQHVSCHYLLDIRLFNLAWTCKEYIIILLAYFPILQSHHCNIMTVSICTEWIRPSSKLWPRQCLLASCYQYGTTKQSSGYNIKYNFCFCFSLTSSLPHTFACHSMPCICY